MCPDRQLISSYVDGEVPSPWKERIAEHLASCPDCAKAARRYTALAGGLAAIPGSDEAASLTRLRARLEPRFSGIERRPREGGFARGPQGRYIVLPLPIAAGIAFFFLAGFGAMLAFSPSAMASRAAMRSMAASAAELQARPVSSLEAATSMEDLLSMLDSQSSPITLTIQLPAGTTLRDSGEPRIIRAPARDEPKTGLVPVSVPAAAPTAKAQEDSP